MNEREISDMKEKVEFFMDSRLKVHLDLKDGTFLNGNFIKQVRDNVYWLEEDKIGEVFVFLKDIIKIEQYRKKEENYK
jgi:hypothetical protein